ncbi:MAG: phosphoribosylglycinamide formyltransferase 1 [Thermosipho sp. (in: thermotogales)]|jgi:phosphoribosylglycinamide formyltransferase-1|nr:phosphoribosylglycinamide formyltransferase 1 [Thermosipho sp. (in: thermotogales)]MDK2907360.1 phosphoribosylglycinamide formyltransferase 1 [Petrotoga sp.]
MEPKIAVFAYNFPHKKTQDFLIRLFLENIKVSCIFAADPVPLNIPKHTIKVKINHSALIHPKEIAERLNIDYYVLPHNSAELVEIVKERNIELGIIAGARILKPHIIKSFPLGIINFHPGLIPEARGLDAMLWSIYNDIPLGVTAHLIDERIDAGSVLIKEKIPIYEDDTLLELSERLYEKQLDLIKRAVEKAIKREYINLDYVGSYNKKMSPELEKEVIKKLPEYIKKFKVSK